MSAADDQLPLSNWIAVVALASPHLLYAYIWYNSDRFYAAFKKRSCEVFEWLAWGLKREWRGAS